MIKKTIFTLALLFVPVASATWNNAVAQRVDDVPNLIERREAAVEPRAAARGTFQAPIYDPPVTIPVGGLAMLDVPGITPDKLDVAIIGGSYAWDGRQVVYTAKSPRPRLLFDGLSNQPLLLVPTNEEFRGTYHIILVGGETLRIIPLTIGTGLAPAPVDPVPPGPVPPGPVTPPVVVPSKVQQVTYVYEKELHPQPNPAVMSALNKLNREHGILATLLELPGPNARIPELHKLAVAAAKEAGLPALVADGHGKVIRVVKSPTTEAQVMEAIR